MVAGKIYREGEGGQIAQLLEGNISKGTTSSLLAQWVIKGDSEISGTLITVSRAGRISHPCGGLQYNGQIFNSPLGGGGHLDRGGPLCHNSQPVVGCVAGQLNQDVDIVVAHHLRQLLLAEPRHLFPLPACGLHSCL